MILDVLSLLPTLVSVQILEFGCLARLGEKKAFFELAVTIRTAQGVTIATENRLERRVGQQLGLKATLQTPLDKVECDNVSKLGQFEGPPTKVDDHFGTFVVLEHSEVVSKDVPLLLLGLLGEMVTTGMSEFVDGLCDFIHVVFPFRPLPGSQRVSCVGGIF